MAGKIVCKCGPAFTQNLFTILGILLVLSLVLRFFSKSFLPELWGKVSSVGNQAIDAVGLSGHQEGGEGGEGGEEFEVGQGGTEGFY